MYLQQMVQSTYHYIIKLFTTDLFYIGGAAVGVLLHLTGLSVAQLQSIMTVVFLDIATRCWAEKKNGRPILSKKMFYGFTGKLTAYMILFILSQNAFIFKDYFLYLLLGGFTVIESRSVFENLVDAGHGKKLVTLIKDKFNDKIEEFTGSSEKVRDVEVYRPEKEDFQDNSNQNNNTPTI